MSVMSVTLYQLTKEVVVIKPSATADPLKCAL